MEIGSFNGFLSLKPEAISASEAFVEFTEALRQQQIKLARNLGMTVAELHSSDPEHI